MTFMMTEHLFTRVLVPYGISIAHHYQYSNHAMRAQNSAFIANIMQPPSNLHVYIQIHTLSKLISTVIWTQEQKDMTEKKSMMEHSLRATVMCTLYD